MSGLLNLVTQNSIFEFGHTRKDAHKVQENPSKVSETIVREDLM